MNKNISINPDLDKQLMRLRIKYGDKEEGMPTSYSKVIKRVMKKAKVWVED
jgi:hypothetical protein